MYQLKPDELLTKVTEYNLFRREKIWIKILVHEFVAGEPLNPGQYQAVPTGPGGRAPNEFIGVGDSEKEALQDCLERLQQVDEKTILHWLHKKKG